MTFFEICLDDISYDTPYLQVCNEKKKCLKIFFLREISSAAPTVASPAAMADVTGDAFLPPSAQDLHTTTLKSPKKRDKIAAAVGHGATDASVPASKS